jgi:uncharacterized membrane protein YczE
MKLTAVKAVPRVSWSSQQPMTFRPRGFTFFFLCFGLVVFGVGEGLLIAAGVGVSPWTVFAQGIASITGLRIGLSTFFVSVAVLLLWIPLRQRPGLGTVMNALLIAGAIDLSLPYLPAPDNIVLKLVETIMGILLVGIGSGMYLIANLGPGPRDGLMTGLQRRTNLPIAWVRMSIEVLVVALGWLLGGTVGAGTVFYALGIGWSVATGLAVVERCSRTATPAAEA